MRYRIAATLLTTALLGACSKPAETPPPKPQAATVSPSKGGEITKENQGILTDTQAKAMNEANQVSNNLEKAEEERRKKMEAQGI
ncbi:MAG TPA: hypothetical protein VMH83_03895 [Candidatus Acidoferrum sp.]|nr:hypothetical protein [Candidatus Acidoferrum sp.]